MKIVIKCVDGSIQVMTLVGEADLSEALHKWSDVHPGKYLNHRVMPDDAIPINREFREAWADTTPEPVIDIDMTKARTMQLNRIRTLRDGCLIKLDKESIKMQDIGDDVNLAKIRQKKQKLRDLPQTIQARLDAAVSVDDLRKILTDSDVIDILS